MAAKEETGTKTTTSPSNATAKNENDRKGGLYKVIVPLLNIRERATLSSEVKGTLAEGEEVAIASRTPQGFGKLADGSGYVLLEYVECVKQADEA